METDADFEGFAAYLKRAATERLLCYGPPGTGTMALAKHLVQKLELPFLQFLASDTLGPYVGIPEKNIANVFF